MVTEKFRRQLRKEATQWRSDALISSDVYHQLSERYEFDTIDSHARDRFVAILIIVGSVLLGISVITFVAANWQAIPRIIKVMLMMDVLIAVNTIGFYLWRSPRSASSSQTPLPRSQWRQRLGHGLLICGALVLGANFALMGQLFHQRGTAFGLCIIWGLGVLTMAYGLRLTSLAVIAFGLILLGYWIEFISYDAYVLAPLIRHIFDIMPLVIGVLFLPLAYWCRSRIVFGLTVIGVGFSLALTIGTLSNTVQDPFGITLAIALILPAALWWAYADDGWQHILPRFISAENGREDTEESIVFRPIARSLTIIYLGCLFYVLSFHGLWEDYSLPASASTASVADVFMALVTNINVVVIVITTLAVWLWLGWPRIGHQWRLVTTDIVVLAMLAMTGGVVIWHEAIAPLLVLGTLMFNILLFLVAAGLMREGLADGDRRQFWFGFVLLILQIISRVFEYETGLLIKSFTFLVCGIGIIVIGLWFERYVRALIPQSGQSLQAINSEEDG